MITLYYLKMAVRFLMRARSYTIINLLGLAFSLACSIILIRYIHRELTVDVNCVDAETVVVPLRDMAGNVYIGLNYPETENDSFRVEEESIVERCFLVEQEQDNILYENRNYAANVLAVDSTFFHFFAYPVYEGKADLRSPDAAVITREFAKRIFGKENPIGKVLEYGKQSVVVHGVIDEPSCKTSWRFDILVSRQLRADWKKLNMEMMRVLPSVDLSELNEKAYVYRQIGRYSYRYKYISWKDLYFEPSIVGQYKSVFQFGNWQYIRILIGVVGLLLLVGMLNFTNLYMVYMMKRSKAYGIKKVFGQSRMVLFGEIWLENFLLMAMALFVAWLLVELTAVPVSRLMEDAVGYTPFDVWLSAGILLLVPLLTTLYPFLKYSYGTPVASMRLEVAVRRSVTGRMMFLFIQYSVAFLLILLSLYFNCHFEFLINTPPGFRTERILKAELQHETNWQWNEERWKREDLLRQKLDECPYIDTWMFSYYSALGKSQGDIINDKDQSVSMLQYFPSTDFFKIFGLKVLEGKLPDKIDMPLDVQIVLNKAAMKALGYTRIEDAFVRSDTPLMVGYMDGKLTEVGMSMMPVVAVVDDYFPGHLTEGVKPMIFVVGAKSNSGSVYISVKEGKEHELFSYLRRMEQEIYNTEDFSYSWMADEVADLYVHDRNVASIYSVFAFIAIVVSCLGLFGISLFDIRQRYREIAIRKTNGAQTGNLYRLLFGKYLKVLAVSFIVAVPLGWYIIYRYTEDMSVKAPISIWIFIMAFVSVMLISLGTLWWQVNKAARINPADVMKSE